MEDEKQDAALLPIRVRKESADRIRFTIAVDVEFCGYSQRSGGWCSEPAGHSGSCSMDPPRAKWTWDAEQLRAASKALAALADQLGEPRRNAGPGCTFTREDALVHLQRAGHTNPIAYIGDGCCVIGNGCGDMAQGATWWEASAKVGLFGFEIARRMRDSCMPTLPHF